ncbi:MAG: hypothetical protein ACRC5R_06410 [Mycoplasmatales bacterium]
MMEKYFGKFSSNNFLIVFIIIITVISISSMFQPLYVNIPFNIILPIFILVSMKMVFFERMKLSTLVIMRVLIVFAALNIINGSFYVKIVLIFLIINILEATFTDFKIKKYYNVITGLALVATVPLITGTWLGVYYSATTTNVVGIICWIIVYTIWNFIFVTNEFTESIAKLHVGILLTPLLSIVLLGNPGYWLIIRANSLIIGGVIQIANKSFIEEKLVSKRFSKFVALTKKNNVQIYIMVINLLLITVMVILHFMKVGG